MQLTEEQLCIVNHRAGHARVSAVAGSGKTSTMVARLAHLLNRGTGADQILVLMFNKSARDGFDALLKTQLPGCNKRPEVRTFHSLGLRLVNSFTRRGALPNHKLITHEYVAERLARQVANVVYGQWTEEEAYLTNEDIEEFLGFIDRVKSVVKDPRQLFKQLDYPSRLDFFPEAYKLFEQTRKEQGIRFYADLIHEPVMAMLGDPDLAAWVSDRVDHIVVDEYQDINETQQQLLKIIAGSRAAVMVVGDVDQCIYEWRGAQPDYITTRFALDFPHPLLYNLSSTFRYGHQLSLAANHLIANNSKRDQKQCLSHPENGPSHILCIEEKGKKHPILGVISRWLEEGRSLTEAVILVRLYAQTVPVELALLEAGIAYSLEGSSDIFECQEIHALMGYLRLLLGSLDESPRELQQKMFLAMLCQPHLGISREEMERVVQALITRSVAAPEILLDWSRGDFAPYIKKRFVEAAENWKWLQQCSGSQAGGPFLKKMVERFKLYDFYHSFAIRTATAENRVKTCEAFIQFAGEHKLSIVELVNRIETFRNDKRCRQEIDEKRVLLTSVHRAKGLEWPLVMLPGLEDGHFPFSRDRQEGVELEDERRLFYVAITRAIERLVCFYPLDAQFTRAMSTYSATLPPRPVRASRFLYEANLGLSIRLGSLLEESGTGGIKLRADDPAIAVQYLKAVGRQDLLVEGSGAVNKGQQAEAKERGAVLKIEEIIVGMTVFHCRFGVGRVLAIKNKKQGRLTVSFDDHGEMILLAAYAKLETYYQ